MFHTCPLNKRVAGARSDSTLVVFVSRHHNVTFHSPTGSPRVLHQPVVLSLVNSITNDENCMIQLRTATGTEGTQILISFFLMYFRNFSICLLWKKRSDLRQEATAALYQTEVDKGLSYVYFFNIKIYVSLKLVFYMNPFWKVLKKQSETLIKLLPLEFTFSKTPK